MLRFKPYPGFTIFAAIAIALLCGLGVWQLDRLHQKLDRIARIQRSLTNAPVPLIGAMQLKPGTAFDSSDADYRKVIAKGYYRNDQEIYFFITAGGTPVYHVLTPFVTNGATMIVDRGAIPLDMADPAKRRAGQLQGEQTLVGLLRDPDRPGWFTPPIDVAHRITHSRDPGTLAAAFGLGPVAPLFLEADATPNPGGWPRGGQTVVDLPNNHLSYAVTWFGLAWGLFCIWIAYHVSKGRLAWGRRGAYKAPPKG